MAPKKLLRDSRATTPKSMINEYEAAELLGYSVFWMRRKRWEGGGPPFFKAPGGAVRYRREDIEAFIEARMATSTSGYKTTPQAA